MVLLEKQRNYVLRILIVGRQEDSGEYNEPSKTILLVLRWQITSRVTTVS